MDFLLTRQFRVKLAKDNRSEEFVAIKIIKRHHVEKISIEMFK